MNDRTKLFALLIGFAVWFGTAVYVAFAVPPLSVATALGTYVDGLGNRAVFVMVSPPVPKKTNTEIAFNLDLKTGELTRTKPPFRIGWWNRNEIRSRYLAHDYIANQLSVVKYDRETGAMVEGMKASLEPYDYAHDLCNSRYIIRWSQGSILVTDVESRTTTTVSARANSVVREIVASKDSPDFIVSYFGNGALFDFTLEAWEIRDSTPIKRHSHNGGLHTPVLVDSQFAFVTKGKRAIKYVSLSTGKVEEAFPITQFDELPIKATAN